MQAVARYPVDVSPALCLLHSAELVKLLWGRQAHSHSCLLQLRSLLLWWKTHSPMPLEGLSSAVSSAVHFLTHSPVIE
jgi:hypothetical protein